MYAKADLRFKPGLALKSDGASGMFYDRFCIFKMLLIFYLNYKCFNISSKIVCLISSYIIIQAYIRFTRLVN